MALWVHRKSSFTPLQLDMTRDGSRWRMNDDVTHNLKFEVGIPLQIINSEVFGSSIDRRRTCHMPTITILKCNAKGYVL
jgi:hypothetical protein